MYPASLGYKVSCISQAGDLTQGRGNHTTCLTRGEEGPVSHFPGHRYKVGAAWAEMMG